MKTRTWRTIHRYLGLVIGIQLFFWTASGLIFSWNSIESVRGENMVRHPVENDLRSTTLKSPEDILRSSEDGDSSHAQVPVSATYRTMLDTFVCEVTYESENRREVVLYDAVTGDRLSPIDEVTATELARRDFAGDADVTSIEKIESTGSHSEYRNKELPAYRVTLDHATNPSIYISANRGTVTTRRNNQWRLFDFFWMLHTMDYQGRDNFNHWLLKGMSVFGMATVLSGFGLWVKTSRLFRGSRKRSRGGDAL